MMIIQKRLRVRVHITFVSQEKHQNKTVLVSL